MQELSENVIESKKEFMIVGLGRRRNADYYAR
jgi:hypothetical protein